jgi:hypothetical protein
MQDLSLSSLDGRSAVGRPIQREETAFFLSSINFSIPLSLFCNSDIIYFCRTCIVSSAQLKLSVVTSRVLKMVNKSNLQSKNTVYSLTLPHVLVLNLVALQTFVAARVFPVMS